ncbi:unnamed protein product [Enterobius vermicularis]|uniref:Uncharacterized protein n=1 Tax=Enterobius vermicularis TaxID=51028 RepID=A0A0N4VNX0_ENTVE|nr:unnamed protein product [Enterobius vermicularis]
MIGTQVHTGLLPHPMDASSRIPPIHRVIGTAYEHANTAPVCRPSSDCGGSSSGLGGMTKTDIVSSDDSSLARFVIFSSLLLPSSTTLSNGTSC